LKLANLARWKGDLDGARAVLEQILANEPGNIEANILRASLASDAGTLTNVRELLQRIRGFPNAASEAGAIDVLEAELSLRSGTVEGVQALLDRGKTNGAPVGEHAHVLGLLKLRTYQIPDAL